MLRSLTYYRESSWADDTIVSEAEVLVRVLLTVYLPFRGGPELASVLGMSWDIAGDLVP